MPVYQVYEVYEEIRLCMRSHEIEADNEDDAIEQARDSNMPPDRKGEEEYGISGFAVFAPGESSDDAWMAACDDLSARQLYQDLDT